MSVGMPQALWLDEFGSQVWAAFGEIPYHVGSSLRDKSWRDVDVRLLLADEVYAQMGLGDPEATHRNEKWVALCLAFSALGKQMTGLPIDFQIQQQTWANSKFKIPENPRSAIGLIPLRYARFAPPASAAGSTEAPVGKMALFCVRCEFEANDPPHESGICPGCRSKN